MWWWKDGEMQIGEGNRWAIGTPIEIEHNNGKEQVEATEETGASVGKGT